MEKETLEEAAENYCSNNHAINEDRAAWQDIEFAFKDGAKWQAEQLFKDEAIQTLEKSIFLLLKKQERMYSEEDMIEFAKWVFLEVGSNTGKDRTNKELFNEWFEQFKNK